MQTKCSRSAEYVTEQAIIEAKINRDHLDVAIIEAEINRDHLDVVLPSYLEYIGTAEARQLLECFRQIQRKRKPILA